MGSNSLRNEHDYDSLTQEEHNQSDIHHRAESVEEHDILISKQEQSGCRACHHQQHGQHECLSQPSSLQSSQQRQRSILSNPIVICILITETAERVAYFGFRAILVLYFTDALYFTNSEAVALCELNSSMVFLSPIIGALLADGSWGRYKTILRFGWTYAFGLVLITIAAYSTYKQSQDQNESLLEEDELGQQKSKLGLERLISFVGLSLVSLGTGGIKPCVCAFGADQVALEDTDDSHDETTVKSNNFSRLEGDDKKSDGVNDTQFAQGSVGLLKEERIREFFSSFYICINVGALGSFALIPIIRAKFGFGTAFLVPTVFMTFALILFWSQRNNYKYSRQRQHKKLDDQEEEEEEEEVEEEYSLGQLFGAFCRIATQRLCKYQCFVSLRDLFYMRKYSDHKPVPTSLDKTIEDDIPTSKSFNEMVEDYFPSSHEGNNIHTRQQSIGACSYSSHRQQEQEPGGNVYHDAAQVWHVLPLLFFYPIFWLLYDLQGSVWILQARRMALHGLQPEQSFVVNPLQIMIFVPLCDRIIYPFLEKKMGWDISPLKRMNLGMILASASFIVCALVEQQIQRQPALSVHVFWQLPQITIITIAEVLLNVTGLEFVYTQSPPKTQALVLALYYLMTAVGDGLGAILFATIFGSLDDITVMYLCSLFMMINWGLFWYVSHRWKPYHQQEVDGNVEQYDELGREKSIEMGNGIIELRQLPTIGSATKD